jgi:hypothetical protein
MKCAYCGTMMKVYTGEEGSEFQSNFDAPSNTEVGSADAAGEV